MVRTGGGNYDYFAEFIDVPISKADIRELSSSFREDKYQNNPDLMLKEIDKYFMKVWDDNAATSPARGNADTQRKNFEKFLKDKVLSREKLKYTNPYTKESNAIDFTPIFSEYVEAEREFVKPSVPSKRVEDSIQLLKTPSTVTREDALEFVKGELKRRGEITFQDKTITKDNVDDIDTRTLKSIWTTDRGDRLKEKKLTSTTFYRRLDKQIDLSERSENYENLVKIRDALRDFVKSPKNDLVLSSYNAKKLYDKIENKLDERYQSPTDLLRSKSDERLKGLLEFKGVDTSKLNTSAKLKAAAKKEGFGLRNYQKNKDELIFDILSVKTGADRADLEKRPLSYLQDLNEKINPRLYRPKQDFYLRKGDLPTTDGQIKDILKNEGVNVTDDKLKREIKKNKKYIKSKFPFLSNDQLEREAKREYASNLIFADPTVKNRALIEEEIERRFMEDQYGDPNLEPNFKDLISISKLKNKEFKERISRDEFEIVDPRTKKKKTVKKVIPIKAWRTYRDSLKDRVGKAQQIVDVKREEQVSKFLEKEVPELSGFGFDDEQLMELARTPKEIESPSGLTGEEKIEEQDGEFRIV
jgi:hypothetical protein